MLQRLLKAHIKHKHLSSCLCNKQAPRAVPQQGGPDRLASPGEPSALLKTNQFHSNAVSWKAALVTC